MKIGLLAIVAMLLLSACEVYNNRVSILSNVSTIDDIKTKRFKQGVKND